jgi:hypothetical protein
VIEIDKITLREIQLRLKEPFTISTGTQFDRRILLLELTSSPVELAALPPRWPFTISVSSMGCRSGAEACWRAASAGLTMWLWLRYQTFRCLATFPPSSRYWNPDIVDPEWTMNDDGTVNVPRHVPGMGVSVNRGRVTELTVRSFEIDRSQSIAGL